MSVELAGRPEIEVAAEGVVTDDGDLVVPSAELERLVLVPGQRVPVTVTARRRRKNMRGVLAGKVRDISLEEIEESSREAWGEWAK